jgi:twitching motility two-component system response regulator PilH
MAKILIAEDSPTAAAVLSRMLAPLGHTILLASDGENAVRRIHSEHPDLVILDIIMPKVNGFQLCRTIRSDPALKDVPIIVVTSMDRESDRYWGLKQGADEYLIKPVDAGTLVDRVRHYLSPTQ